MSKTEEDKLRALSGMDGEQRYKYLVKAILEHDELWILADNDGCVMLNTEEEDCVPVWPHEALAQAWATGKWRDCKATRIPLKKWFKDWTQGLIDDDLAIAAFPNDEEEGLVIYPDELEFALKRKIKSNH